MGRKPFFVGFVKIGIVNRLGPPMNRAAGNPKVRLLTGFAALLLSGFIAVSVLGLMYSEYPATGRHCGFRTTKSEIVQVLTISSDSTCKPIRLCSGCFWPSSLVICRSLT